VSDEDLMNFLFDLRGEEQSATEQEDESEDYMTEQEVREKCQEMRPNCPEDFIQECVDTSSDCQNKVLVTRKGWEKFWKQFLEHMAEVEKGETEEAERAAQPRPRPSKSKKLPPTKAATQTTLFGDRSSSSAPAKVVTFKNGNFQMQMC